MDYKEEILQREKERAIFEEKELAFNKANPSRKVFLINSSNNSELNFTIKRTINYKFPEISTEIITLKPGLQEELGCDKIKKEDKIYNINYEIVAEYKSKSKAKD